MHNTMSCECYCRYINSCNTISMNINRILAAIVTLVSLISQPFSTPYDDCCLLPVLFALLFVLLFVLLLFYILPFVLVLLLSVQRKIPCLRQSKITFIITVIVLTFILTIAVVLDFCWQYSSYYYCPLVLVSLLFSILVIFHFATTFNS